MAQISISGYINSDQEIIDSIGASLGCISAFYQSIKEIAVGGDCSISKSMAGIFDSEPGDRSIPYEGGLSLEVLAEKERLLSRTKLQAEALRLEAIMVGCAGRLTGVTASQWVNGGTDTYDDTLLGKVPGLTRESAIELFSVLRSSEMEVLLEQNLRNRCCRIVEMHYFLSNRFALLSDRAASEGPGSASS